MKRMALFALLALASLALAGCCCCWAFRRPEPRYGREFNVERMKVGLPIIEEDWQLGYSGESGCRWVNPVRQEKYDSHQPVHFSKSLDYRTGTLLSEGDTYYGREDCTDVDGTFREKLGIGYHFQVDEYDWEKKLGWSAWLEDRDGVRSISLEEAEQVLERWGIRRLSYDFPPNE